MNRPVRPLFAGALLLITAFLFIFCERSEYTNRFTTPVASIGNHWIALENGRDVRIPASRRSETTILVLVRHAEKSTGGDPPLTAQGRRRAEKLAKLLQEMQLDEIYASPYVRTEQTAGPVAEAQGLKISAYDPERLEDFLELVKIRNKGERVLIVGHSNTTPHLLNLLLDREAYEQIEADDYNNLYIASIEGHGQVNILSLRFTLE